MTTLALALAAGAAPPGTEPKSEATYRQLELFARVLSHVQNNYVDPVDDQQLIFGAIKGMLDTLDPHTQFMPPEVFKELRDRHVGRVRRPGSSRSRASNDNHGGGRTRRRHPGAAGRRSSPGDQLLKIDEEPTRAMELDAGDAEDARARGQEGAADHHARGLHRAARVRDRSVTTFASRRSRARCSAASGYVKVKNFQERTDASLAKRAGAASRALNSGKELRGLVHGPAEQPGRAAGSGGGGEPTGSLVGGHGHRLDPRPRRGAGSVKRPREGSRHREADYPLVVLVNAGSRVGVGDRRGRPAGPPPRHGAHGRAHLRQGQRADRDGDGGRLGPEADHRALLHAVGPERFRSAAFFPTSIVGESEGGQLTKSETGAREGPEAALPRQRAGAPDVAALKIVAAREPQGVGGERAG
jgi:hypothetical protein